MADPTSMRWIERIVIRDVLAIEYADIKVSRVGMQIRGRTGSGKTAVLNGLQAVFDENMRTKMVREGADHGEILLVMNDGTQARRKISDAGMERPRLEGPNGKALPSPVQKLRAMAPALLLNPVRFIEKDETEKAKILAEVFPVELPQAELEAICGEDVDLRDVEPETNGLARANQAYAAAYKARHAENGRLDQSESARDAERKKIPEGFDAHAARGLSSESIAHELAQIEHRNRLVTDGTTQMAKLEGEERSLQAAIENLRRELAAKETQLSEVRDRLQNGRQWLATNTTIDPTPIQAKLRSLDQQRLYLHCFDAAEAYDIQCREIRAKALRLDAICATLKALPAELVRRAQIPMPGLTLENGVILVNGRPIDNLSEGEQRRFAVKVAAAGVKDLGIVCIDGAESMSEAARAELIDELTAEGIQVFMTVADECDFDIRDFAGQPVDAKVIIPTGSAPSHAGQGSIAAIAPQTRVLRAPQTASRSTALGPTAPPLSAPVAKPITSLFDPSPQNEVLFSEPSL